MSTLLVPNPDSTMSYQQAQESKRVHLDNLYRMVQYCENQADCRRSQLLQYFGEVFDKQACRKMPEAICDNCAAQVKDGVSLWEIVFEHNVRDLML